MNLFFKDQDSSINSVLKIFDLEDNELISFNGSSSQWSEVDVNTASLGSAITKITLENNGSNGYTVIDDFGFITTEENNGGSLPISDPFPETIGNGSMRVRLRTITSGLTAPNWGVAAPGEDSYLYNVSDQNGIFWKINLLTGEKIQYLDLSSRLVPLGILGENSFDERGFLGFAFHPPPSTLNTRQTDDYIPIPQNLLMEYLISLLYLQVLRLIIKALLWSGN